MAIEVDYTLPELKKLAEDLGVNYVASGKNGRIMKGDIIVPLRNHYLINRYGSLSNVPLHMETILKMDGPMLATRLDSVKQELQDEVWSSDEWELDEKLNGARMMMVFDGGGLCLYSRHNSVKDLLPINFTPNILFPKGSVDKLMAGGLKPFILDTEITSDDRNIVTILNNQGGVKTETELQAITALLSSTPERAIAIQKANNLILRFNVIDVPFVDGMWISGEDLRQRRKAMDYLCSKMQEFGFKINLIRKSTTDKKNKEGFHNRLILEGKEGSVAKRLSSKYRMDGGRGNDWLKIKRSVSQSLQGAGLDMYGDTVDAFITGATEGEGLFQGLIGAMVCSIYLDKEDGSRVEHEIARISGINMELRRDMTSVVNGVVTLNPEYYGRVVEIDGQGVSSRERRLNHAVLVNFRYDKNKDSCYISEDFLNKMIL